MRCPLSHGVLVARWDAWAPASREAVCVSELALLSAEFEEPRVIDLWDLARSANFTEKELESFRVRRARGVPALNLAHLCSGGLRTWKGPCCFFVFSGSQLAVHRALLASGWRLCWTALHWPSREAGPHEEGAVEATGLSGGPAGKGPGQEATFLRQEPGEGSLPGPVASKIFPSCVGG